MMKTTNGTLSYYNSELHTSLTCNYTADPSYLNPSEGIKDLFKDYFCNDFACGIKQIKVELNPCSLKTKLTPTVIKINEGIFKSWWRDTNTVESAFSLNLPFISFECSSEYENDGTMTQDQFNLAGTYYTESVAQKYTFIESACLNKLGEMCHYPIINYSSSSSFNAKNLTVSVGTLCLSIFLCSVVLGKIYFAHLKKRKNEEMKTYNDDPFFQANVMTQKVY